MPIKIETVQTDTCSMNYFRFGKGERTLVILPGLSVRSVMHSADAIADEYQAMQDAFTIYVIDRRKDLPPVYSIRDMARDTAVAIRALGLDRICLFGASQGGMIAQVIAIENPDLVEKLALGSTSPQIYEEQYRVLAHWVELAKRGDKEGLYLSFGQEIYPPEVFALLKEPLVNAAAAVTDEDLARFIIHAEGSKGFDVTKELDSIQCPVLVMGAYDDDVLDSDETMEIAEKLEQHTDVSLYMYIGFGHAAFETAPDYRNRLLRFFTES